MLARARTQISPATCVMLLLLTAVGGLLYVKWLPYTFRAVTAQSTHSIGHSILTGGAAQAPAVSLRAAVDYGVSYGRAIWQAMVLGLLLGAGLQELTPRALISRLLGRRGWRSVAAGTLLSIPGMMCTCCAAPVVIGLRREKASPSSAVAFWLGNTVLNPATLIFTGFVLGWQWTGLRLLFGIVMIVAAAYLVDRVAGPDALPIQDRAELEPVESFHPSITGWITKFLHLAAGLIPEYVVIVLLLGAGRAWLFPLIGPSVNNSLLWIIGMAAAGLIFVIPTAGEVPIVQAMLMLGISGGPAAALLLTLPPVSLPSIAMTKSVFSSRVLAVVAGTILVVGISAGFAAAALGFHG